MDIKKGQLYKNRTFIYLYPLLKLYGKELTSRINLITKLAIGISDTNKELDGMNLYILLDCNGKGILPQTINYHRKLVQDFLEWVKYESYYSTDYVYNNEKGKESHMVVVKIPQSHSGSYIHFLNGEYSKMYTKFEVYEFYKDVQNKDLHKAIQINLEKFKIRSILTKSVVYRKEFVTKVNKLFNSTVDEEVFSTSELDFPFNIDEEVFNSNVNSNNYWNINTW